MQLMKIDLVQEIGGLFNQLTKSIIIEPTKLGKPTEKLNQRGSDKGLQFRPPGRQIIYQIVAYTTKTRQQNETASKQVDYLSIKKIKKAGRLRISSRSCKARLWSVTCLSKLELASIKA